jgi:hypothetical protein
MGRMDSYGNKVFRTRLVLAMVVVTAMVALAMPGVSTATPAAGFDRVTGEGVTDSSGGLTTSFTLDAQSGRSGESPSGSVGFDEDNGLLTAGGTVTCLSVKGNTATIGYAGNASVDHGTFFSPIAGYIRVVDGGGPGSSQDKFAEVGASPITPPPRDCTLAPPAPSFLTVIRGDIVVHDALTFLEAKFACVAERGQLGRRAFRAKYGTPDHALRNCINLRQA